MMMAKSTDESSEGRPLSSSDDLVKGFLQLYQRCPAKYSSPRKFFAFLQAYINVTNRKRSKTVLKLKHLEVINYFNNGCQELCTNLCLGWSL